MEGFGGRFIRWLGGHRATSTYRATNSPVLRTSMLATTRVLVSKLATARLFCFPIANQHAFSPSPSPPPLISQFFPRLTHFVSPQTGIFTFPLRFTFSNDIFERSHSLWSFVIQPGLDLPDSLYEQGSFSGPGWVSWIYPRDATG